jgi:hypothetical protein
LSTESFTIVTSHDITARCSISAIGHQTGRRISDALVRLSAH